MQKKISMEVTFRHVVCSTAWHETEINDLEDCAKHPIGILVIKNPVFSIIEFTVSTNVSRVTSGPERSLLS